MLRGCLRQSEIAEKYGLALKSVRRLAMGTNWPPVEMQIGSVRFYSADAVAFYFARRIDRRTLKGESRKRSRAQSKRRTNCRKT